MDNDKAECGNAFPLIARSEGVEEKTEHAQTEIV